MGRRLAEVVADGTTVATAWASELRTGVGWRTGAALSTGGMTGWTPGNVAAGVAPGLGGWGSHGSTPSRMAEMADRSSLGMVGCVG